MELLKNQTYSIGDLVSRYGVAAQSLRNWEDQGLIPQARRTPGKHRRYGHEHVRALDALLGYRPPVAPPATTGATAAQASQSLAQASREVSGMSPRLATSAVSRSVTSAIPARSAG